MCLFGFLPEFMAESFQLTACQEMGHLFVLLAQRGLRPVEQQQHLRAEVSSPSVPQPTRRHCISCRAGLGRTTRAAPGQLHQGQELGSCHCPPSSEGQGHKGRDKWEPLYCSLRLFDSWGALHEGREDRKATWSHNIVKTLTKCTTEVLRKLL